MRKGLTVARFCLLLRRSTILRYILRVVQASFLSFYGTRPPVVLTRSKVRMTLKRDIGRSPVVPSLRPRGRLSDRNDTRTRKERRLCTRTTVDVDPTSFPHTEERHPKDRNGIRTTEDDYERHRTVLKDEIRTTIEGRLPLEQREEDMTFRTTDRHPTDKIVSERPVTDGPTSDR